MKNNAFKFFICLIIAILVFFFIIPLVKYNHAQKLLELGKYDLAYTAFSELGEFRDSQDKLIETRYLQAVDYRKAKEYNIANSIFESLGNYRDSKILIHTHDYIESDFVSPTCTSNGSETMACSTCGDSKVKILEAKHNYVLSKQTNATCLSPGEKSFSCSVCGDSYTEKIEQVEHSWEDATCSSPKVCSTCGAIEGKALGHSDDVICSRCGLIQFETQEHSGYGVSSITGINLPKGKYNFIFTHSGSSNFIARGSEEIWVNEIGKVSYVCQIDCSHSGMKNGYINITNADGYWTIKIEAIGN